MKKLYSNVCVELCSCKKEMPDTYTRTAQWMFMWRDMNLMEKILFLERNKETGKKI